MNQLSVAAFFVLFLALEKPSFLDAFSPKQSTSVRILASSPSLSDTQLHWFNSKDTKSDGSQEESKKEKGGFGFLVDFKGMMNNFDEVVDDFVYKRMGAGEQWYGKRKYNPSGRVDGDYNGMGQSDQFRIELARVQKEEMEKRRLRRLAEEEEQRKNRMK